MTLSPPDVDGLRTLCVTFHPVQLFYLISAAIAFAAGYLLWNEKEKV